MTADAGRSNCWNLNFCLAAVVTPDDDHSGDESSVASDGSQITISNQSPNNSNIVATAPSSPTGPVCTIDLSLMETPPEERCGRSPMTVTL